MTRTNIPIARSEVRKQRRNPSIFNNDELEHPSSTPNRSITCLSVIDSIYEQACTQVRWEGFGEEGPALLQGMALYIPPWSTLPPSLLCRLSNTDTFVKWSLAFFTKASERRTISTPPPSSPRFCFLFLSSPKTIRSQVHEIEIIDPGLRTTFTFMSSYQPLYTSRLWNSYTDNERFYKTVR